MSTKIITIANQKGGVGKTTTAVTLAHGLARAGHHTLLIDFDSQGQVAKFMGIEPCPGAHTLLVIDQQTPESVHFIQSHLRNSGRKQLFILPGNKRTIDAQMQIEKAPIDYVRNALGIFMKKRLEYIVIDTSPSVGGLQERAIWASDFLIIPTAPEYAALEGVSQLYHDVVILFQERDWPGKLLGVLPTLFDEQTRMSKDSMDNLEAVFGDLVLSPIHRATILRDCAAEGLTVFEKDPECRAAQEYQELVRQVERAR